LENNSATAVSPFESGLVIIVTFFLFLFLSAFFLIAFGVGPTLVFGEFIILIVPLTYLLFKRVNIQSFVRIDFKPKFILLGLASGIALLMLNIAVTGILTSIFGTSQAVEQANQLLLDTSNTPTGLALVAASLVLAGICEEFAFRGFLQNAFTRRFSFLPAVIISAAVFGVFHFDPQLIYTLAAFISGFLLGYIYYRTNYVTAAIAHSAMNLIVLAFLLLGV